LCGGEAHVSVHPDERIARRLTPRANRTSGSVRGFAGGEASPSCLRDEKGICRIMEAVRYTEQSLSDRHAALAGEYSFADNSLLIRQAKRESNARSYPRRIPLALKRGRGIYVEDVDGRVFIDCLAAAGTLVLGHNHPVVVEALERALRSELPMQTLDLTTPVKDAFVEELFSLLPAKLASRGRIQFCGPAGTDAVEAAVKLVKTATRRSTMFAFHGGYHGMSQGALSMMGNLGPKRALSGSLGGVQFLPYPYGFRCPFGLGGEAGEDAGLSFIRNLLTDPESGVLPPAGMLLEAVQGEGGVIPCSARWLARLRELCTLHQVPLIIDEVQTGFGRTGKLFAFEHAQITPDVVVLSKALGGGLPLSVVVYDESLDTWQPGSHAGTFRGNQLGMVAGLATLQFIRKERLVDHAEAMGRRLHAHLGALASQHRCVGELRGRGLMLGLELVDPSGERDARGHPLASPQLASALQRACLRRGLIVELGGRHGGTLRLLPPLIITEAEVDRVAEIIGRALRDIEKASPAVRQA
jgi:diaminobutyrate-2-oxoglutarate transaminase